MQQSARQEALQSTISLCCICGEARDDMTAGVGYGTWGSLRSYLKKHSIPEGMVLYSHTFCPPCYMHFKRMFGLEAAEPQYRN